jgi:hypothetical protein
MATGVAKNLSKRIGDHELKTSLVPRVTAPIKSEHRPEAVFVVGLWSGPLVLVAKSFEASGRVGGCNKDRVRSSSHRRILKQ